MSVDFQTLFNIAIGLIGMILGFFLNRVFLGLDRLELQDRKLVEQINTLKVNLPTNYATKQDLIFAMDRVLNKLEVIEAKLDHKADKPVDIHLGEKK